MAGVFLPVGYQMTLTASSAKAGDYTLVGSDDSYAVVAAGATASIGPFNDPRQYNINNLSYSQSASGIYTSADDTALALLAPKASPTFTGTVNLPNSQIAIIAYAVDGAISKSAGVAKLSKAGVGAYTLAAPTTVTDDGLILIITSTTDNAHVITSTALLNDGVTGGSKNTATFAAFAGASITLMAVAAKWHVISSNNVTVA